MTNKIKCPGSGTTDYEARTLPWSGALGDLVFAQCNHCKRVLKPTPHGRLRLHQPRGSTTASLDATRDILWSNAPAKRHFALGLNVRISELAKPVGWGDDNFDLDDYSSSNVGGIQDVAADGSVDVLGWYWRPEDVETI